MFPFSLVRVGVVLGAVGLGLTATAQAALPLRPFALHYDASYQGISGSATLTLEAVGDQQWRHTLSVRGPFASLTQSTLFDAGDKGDAGNESNEPPGWRPLESVSETRVAFHHRRVTAHYDWQAGAATWSGDAKPSRRGPVALQPGDLDGLLVNLAITRAVAQGVVVGQQFPLRLVEAGRARALVYQVAGSETVTVNGQAIAATRIERSDGTKQQIAWVAAGIPAPLRLVQREDGKTTLSLSLRALPGAPPAAPSVRVEGN